MHEAVVGRCGQVGDCSYKYSYSLTTSSVTVNNRYSMLKITGSNPLVDAAGLDAATTTGRK